MTIHEKYMYRCLQLAKKGDGRVKPNPFVGAVIVHNEKIIGEGYHRKFGGSHAEVNAVESVKDTALLADSTLYVSLEPCSHYGKTPPCAEMIVAKKIPKVVIAVSDPNPQVSGKGIEFLRANGIDVSVGILEKEARELNRIFFVNQIYKRPYIILKWAQSKDGFIDHDRTRRNTAPAKISNNITQTLVHRLRTEVQGIMIGTNTALQDNPQLTARKWFGQNPTRILIDRENKIPRDSSIFDNQSKTIVFTEKENLSKNEWTEYIQIDFSNNVNLQILKHLYKNKIFSLLVEGGAYLLNSFIDKNMWDEAFIEISEKKLFLGVKAPEIQGQELSAKKYLDSSQFHLKNKISRNFL